MNANLPSRTATVDATAPAPARIEQTGGWFQVSPFGCFPNSGGWQVFDRGAAAMMVLSFEQAKAADKNWRGVPIFIGHPDGDPKTYRDHKKYGSILALEARNDGLYARAKWSNAGREIIANEHFDYPSPYWHMEPVAGQPGSFRPVQLLSVGLTNWPNIAAKPIGANTAESADLPTPASLSAVQPTADNTRTNMLEPATDRFHRLVYQRIMATGDTQSKAWEYCCQTHKETFAAYQQETAANQAATLVANEAAEATRQKRVADRQSHQASIQLAVDEELARIGNDKLESYSRAFANVQRDRPELFRETDTLASNEARTASTFTQAVQARMKETRSDYCAAFDWVQHTQPELFAAARKANGFS